MAREASSLKGTFLVPSGWLSGEVAWDDEGRIDSVSGKVAEQPSEEEERIVAGFIDPHVHGGGGADAMGGRKSVRTMARYHASCGTAVLLPTTMTALPDSIGEALSGIEEVRRLPQEGEATVMGAHLEGPFISEKRLGAQPDMAIPYDPELVERWLGLAKISVATIAPEIEGGRELLVHLASSGCKVQIGHSDATADEAAAASRTGASGFTHLYNAMSPFHHRDGGVVGHALSHASHAELICDLQHVSVVAIRVACRAIPFAYAVTDSTAAAGLPDGKYPLGTGDVVKKGSTVRTPGGELAGTAMSMFDARQNLVAAGFGEVMAQEMVSARTAAYLGLDEYGTIETGKKASLVRISNARVSGVWLDGKPLEVRQLGD